MEAKLKRDEYSSWEEFKVIKPLVADLYMAHENVQSDFELVVNNAKLYNAPTTVYYKAAEKLAQYGLALIEKEIKNIASPEELKALAKERISYYEGDDSMDGAGEPPEKEGKKRARYADKKNHRLELEENMFSKYNPDGTLVAGESWKRIDCLRSLTVKIGAGPSVSTEPDLWTYTPFQQHIDAYSTEFYYVLYPPSEMQLSGKAI